MTFLSQAAPVDLRQIAAAILLAVIASSPTGAQIFRGAVGGVTIDANGVLESAPAQLRQSTADLIREKMQPAPDELVAKTGLRMVSLRGLAEQIAAAGVTSTAELPDELRCLAGLLRVEYVLVVPERNDIRAGRSWRSVDDWPGRRIRRSHD